MKVKDVLVLKGWNICIMDNIGKGIIAHSDRPLSQAVIENSIKGFHYRNENGAWRTI